MSIPLATSITHQHLLAIIATEMRRRSRFSVVDVGCGGGALMNYLRTGLSVILPHADISVDGFDVSDFAPHGSTNLADGTKTVRTGEPWPYLDHSVDVMTSSQVIEHVSDHRFFFSQTARCLAPNGIAIHLGPVREVLYDDHVAQPFVHKVNDRSARIRLSALFKRLGFYDEQHANVLPKEPGQSFPEVAADYLGKYCNYIPMRQILNEARASGLKPSFDYT